TALQVVMFMFGYQRGPEGRDDITRPRFSPETMMLDGARQLALTKIREAAARKYRDNHISDRHLQRLFRTMEAKGLIVVRRDRSYQKDGKHWVINGTKMWISMARMNTSSTTPASSPSGSVREVA
ncbi:MAG: hypothetical protein EBY81_06925, partial [Verrucomicrobia bacterium]|nr:hypothetical protein [Verrucomicrobiota bacterium]